MSNHVAPPHVQQQPRLHAANVHARDSSTGSPPVAEGLAVQPHSTKMPGSLTIAWSIPLASKCFASFFAINLAKVLGMQEVLRARHVTMAQISKLEEAWKVNPGASVEDLDKPGEDDEPAHVALRYSLQRVDRSSCVVKLGFAVGELTDVVKMM